MKVKNLCNFIELVRERSELKLSSLAIEAKHYSSCLITCSRKLYLEGGLESSCLLGQHTLFVDQLPGNSCDQKEKSCN